jgi:single-stranded-DNA-specific exonuclease
MTKSPQEASHLTAQLEEKNVERQKLTTKVLNRAREQIMSQGISSLLIASDRDFPIGIIGLTAGRLSEEFYRPAVVIRTGDSTSIGSCRSIPEFNIILALNECSNLLTHFGGHSQAAGFTLPTKNLERLRQHLSQMATNQLAELDLRPQLDIDTEITLPALGGDTFQATQQLAPFGRGNPLPIFISRGVEVVACRSMGNNGEHLRMKLRQDDSVWDGVGFRLGIYRAKVSSLLDIVYNLEVDNWGGEERLRLNIIDFVTSISKK